MSSTCTTDPGIDVTFIDGKNFTFLLMGILLYLFYDFAVNQNWVYTPFMSHN